MDNASVESFDGLLVDFANDRKVSIIIKGLRAVSDYEYELQMAQMNAALAAWARHAFPAFDSRSGPFSPRVSSSRSLNTAAR